MDRGDVFFTGFITGFMLGGVVGIGILAAFDAKEGSYREGQIDALTGTVKYELVTNADSTKTWERMD